MIGQIGVLAARQRIAGIRCALIAVVAFQRCAFYTTIDRIAGFDAITDIVIATYRRYGGHTAFDWVAGFAAVTNIAVVLAGQSCAI